MEKNRKDGSGKALMAVRPRLRAGIGPRSAERRSSLAMWSFEQGFDHGAVSLRFKPLAVLILCTRRAQMDSIGFSLAPDFFLF